ncbi:MAG: sugar phosphate isomerase/epimerase [Candidatus Latescibacterota bacterium]|nr:sugar phosphate isomerase/epimerase [Candidatus Latescibacterota bacterium]
MNKSVVAAQLYTLRDFTKTEADIRTTFERVSEIGYKAVQISALGKIEISDLREIADKNELEIIASHISYDLIVNETQKVIDDHKKLSCRHVAIGGLPTEFRNKDGFQRFALECSEAVKPIIEAGLTFSYHNHSFELQKFGDRTGLDILVEESDPAYFSFEIDTYWIQHGGGNPVSCLRRLKDRMHIVHLKDMAMDGTQQLFAEVGEGNLEWEGILSACQNANIEWYIVEQDVCQGDPFESLEVSLNNLKKMGLN